jgi:hypothetical protein
MINKIRKHNLTNYNNYNEISYDSFDDLLLFFLLLSILLNINLISKYKYNKANYKYKRINNKIKKKSVEIQTEPEFISIIVNPNQEYSILK